MPPVRNAVSRRIRGVLSLDDFEIRAKRHLPKPLFGYIAGASETNASLRHNAEEFLKYGFRPRVLTDVSARTTKTTLFGTQYSAPFGISCSRPRRRKPAYLW